MDYVEKELNESYIKEMIILKLKRNYELIERDEFKRELKELVKANGYSDYVELLSFRTINAIINRIEEMKNENVKILFNEEVEILDGDDFIPKTCDVVLIGKDNIEVITIVPLNINVTLSYNSNEVKLLGIGAIDKYLSRMECSKIRLITMQPNLDLYSIYETTVERMLHEYDFNF